MNRWLIAVAMGLMVAGCAEGVEDPQPAPTPTPEQKDPPQETFSGDLNENPYDGIKEGLGTGAPNIPLRNPRPQPGPGGLVPAPESESAE